MYEEDDGPQISSVSWAENTQDEWYLQRVKEVTENPRNYPRSKVVGGQLYMYNPDHILDEVIGDDDAWKIVVPNENRNDILRECHDDPTAGHLGRDKTLARTTQYYFWPKMEADVSKYVRQCLICQQCKVEQRAPTGLMGRRVVERPWQMVAGDIMGPLRKSKQGFEYLLVFQDLFTRWVECIPLRRVKAEVVLKGLKERVFLRYGTPEVFLSDNGTEFKNRMIDTYLSKIGVHHTTIPPYHPQANPVERVNRTLKQMIVSYIEESHDKWDENLHEIVFAYNTAKHSSTGASPALLNYGRNPEPPNSALREQKDAAIEKEEEEALKRWEERMHNLKELHALSNEKSQAEQERQARYYNARRRVPTFKVGDFVWKTNKVLSSAAQGIAAKLAPKFAGPYEITRILGSNTYELKDRDGRVIQPVHSEQMKDYVAPFSEDEDLSPMDNEGGDVIDTSVSESHGTQGAASGQISERAEIVRPTGQAAPKKSRGRPRKTVCVVRRPIVRIRTSHPSTKNTETVPVKRKPGRPKGSKRVEPKDVPSLSPRRTRAQNQRSKGN